jgi:UPF0716 protein FxsA
MLRLFLLFTLLPALELYLLLQIGSLVGPMNTVLIILITGMFGAWLAKREGLAVVTQLAREVETGMPPATRVVEGFLVLAGGLLLVTPGVVTDLAGFSLILPLTRRALAPAVLEAVKQRVTVQTFDPRGPGMGPSATEWTDAPGRPASKLPFDHPVK